MSLVSELSPIYSIYWNIFSNIFPYLHHVWGGMEEQQLYREGYTVWFTGQNNVFHIASCWGVYWDQ